MRRPERRPADERVDRPLPGGRGDDRDREGGLRRRAAAAGPGSSAPAGSCPTPGGPISSSPWPPARAISSAAPRLGLAADLGRGPGTRPSGDATLAAAGSVGAARAGRRSTEIDPRRRRSALPAGAWRPDELDRLGERLERRRPRRRSTSARLADRRDRRRRRGGPRAGPARRPSAGRPGPAAPRRRATARRSAPIAAAAPAGPAPTRAGSRRPSPGRARRRPCAGPPGARLTVIRRGGWTKPGVAERPADALARLLQRGVGQADDREPGQARARRRPRPG